MLLDPPRAGLSAEARKTIIAIAPGQIIYVSCNPATFARDIRAFSRSGYRLEKITLIDLFPATCHAELIGLLERR